MSWSEIKNQIDELSNAWENFKDNNEQRLKIIENRKNSDVLLETQMNSLNKKIDFCKDRIDKMILENKRPNIDTYGASVSQERKDFIDYIRYGEMAQRMSVKAGSANTTSALTNVDTVPSELGFLIHDRFVAMSPIRKLANSIVTNKTEKVDFLIQKTPLPAKWYRNEITAEKDVYGGLDIVSFQIYCLYTQPMISKIILEDIDFNVEEWLVDAMAYNFAKAENLVFFKGTGVDQPLGMLDPANGVANTYVANASNGVTVEDLFNFCYSLDPSIVDDESSAFLMHPSLIQHVRSLKDGNNRYIWNPGFRDSDTLFGNKLYSVSDLYPVSDGKISAVFGNFKKGYQIIDRTSISIFRDPYTSKQFVKLYITKRLGCGVLDSSFLSFLSISQKQG